MRDRKILALILVIVLVMSSFTFAFGVSPGLKTTDSGGNETQKNHFDTKEDVYIYGSNIPDGNYYVRVTNPGGSDNLGTSATASLVVSGGVIDPNPAKIWDYVQFADTTNSGGQYKAWISKNPDFSGDNISTKTFSVGDAIYAIDVTKVANPTSAYVGDEITYSIRVTNNSNVELTDIVVEDSMFPTLEIAPITLAAGAYKDYTVTAAAVLGTMNNTVTASSIMGDVSDTASASVVVTNRPVDPTYAIDVTKVANPTSAYVGDEITYSIRVTNNSSVELTDIVVEDSMFPTLEIAPITLAAGAYKDYTVTASAVLGTMNNTVTASSIVGDVSDTASASVVVTNRPVDPTYAIDVTKVADPTSAYVGDEITYSIRVTNNSSVELTDIVVEDSMFPTLEIAPITLAAGAYKDYTVTAAAVLGTMNNTVTASSITGDVWDSASATVTVTERPPTDGTLIIDKIVTGDLSDETDVFEFNIYPQQAVSVMVVGYYVTASAITDGSIQLPQGYYMVVETDYGSYTPSTTSQYVWITAGQTTSVAFYNDWSSEYTTPGSILINKTVTGNRANSSDIFTYDIVPYYYENGNDLMPNTLQMPQFPLVVTASAVTDGYAGHLEPGWYLVTERDPSPYNLTARSSNDPEYELDGARGIIVYVGEDSQTVVNFTNRYNISTPSSDYRMSITKTADAAEVNVGDLITYTITVTNTGDVTLTNIAVKDEMVDLDEVIATLNVGASRTFTATYLATEEGLLENTATATDDQAPAVLDEALVFVVEGPPLGVPGLVISKTVVGGPNQVFNPGDTVQFKILVTNTGTEKLENILVEDILAGFLQSIPSLDPGQSQEFTVSVTIDESFDEESFDNVATATNTKIGTLRDTATVLVEIEIEEEEPPLDIPDTGSGGALYAYGAGAMLSLLGLLKKKRR